MKNALIFFLFVVSAWAQTVGVQTTVTPANITFSADATTAMQNWFLTQVQSTPTTLAAPMTAGATTMTVTSAAGLTINQEFTVDGEAINPSAIVGSVVTVTRADLGTTATTHASNASVNVLIYKSLRYYVKQAIAQEVSAIMARTAYPTVTMQLAAIATANAAIATAQANGVQ